MVRVSTTTLCCVWHDTSRLNFLSYILQNKNKDGKQQQHSDKQLPSEEMDGGDKVVGETPEVDDAPAIEYPIRAEE